MFRLWVGGFKDFVIKILINNKLHRGMGYKKCHDVIYVRPLIVMLTWIKDKNQTKARHTTIPGIQIAELPSKLFVTSFVSLPFWWTWFRCRSCRSRRWHWSQRGRRGQPLVADVAGGGWHASSELHREHQLEKM